ncbi:GMC family oxidoreductase [Kitasatospora sp. NPDC004272]
MTTADYVVVGAGSAGCVLADRLSADGSTVVLIEAGGPDRAAEISIPAAFPKLFGSAFDWAYSTTEQPGLDGRRIFFPRGRTLGGSSSLNAQIWTRGHRADFDGWAAAGATGWDWDRVLPYYQRAEGRVGESGRDGYGTEGPIPVDDLRDPSPATAAFLAACAAAGYPAIGDGETSARPGAGPVRVTQRNGRRWSAADAYLRPAQQRPQLTVVTGALVRRVLLEGRRAVGVEVSGPDGVQQITARREVVLSAGAVGSPQLLQLSGIGDPAELDRLGIPVEVALPAVGKNLSDHLYVPLAMSARQEISPGLDQHAEQALEYFRHRRGPLSSNLAEALVFLATEEGLPGPDVELVWMLVPFLDSGRGEAQNGVTLGVVLLQPEGRGSVRLQSADPAVAPLIDPGFLADADGRDLATTIAGVKAARQLLARPELDHVVGQPLLAGLHEADDRGLAELVRRHAETLYHPVGSCRMGADETSVVDPELRVRGTTGLRVVDASVMPVVPRGHTHAPTVMLAERAADLIRGLPEPPAVRGRALAGRA